MCGIIGYTGTRRALPIVLDGLRRLEYRGYDSAGVAAPRAGGGLTIAKSPGKLADFAPSVEADGSATAAIGHTRWATHGKPTLENAHPHTDGGGVIAVVHNGIVENYRALRSELEGLGCRFKSQTDTEVIPLLIERRMKEGMPFEEAFRAAAKELKGAQAIVAVHSGEPDKIVGARLGHAGGLVVGFGDGETLIASDLPAIVPHVKQVAYLAAGETATLTPQGASFATIDGASLEKRPEPVVHDPVAAAKGPYRHFMLKEIMEQPETLMSALRDRIDLERMRVDLPGFPFGEARVRSFERVVLIGMGTSYHAAQVGRHMIERLASIPAESDNASEYRYRDPHQGPNTLVISVGQSGETVDTLVAMAEAKRKGAAQITVCNVAGSEAARVADYALLINAGPEFAVASTKTFTGAMVCLFLLSLYLGQLRGTLDDGQVAELLTSLLHLPEQMGEALEETEAYEAVARAHAHATSFLVLGRGVNYPVAMEGALKLKEISYIHAEGYPAGEMKHGPIALIDESVPVVALVVKDRLYDKMMSNIEELRARDGEVIAVATEGDAEIEAKARYVINVPRAPELLTPVLTVAPLQLLAYHIAVRRGCDVDQPRNLAKTVTVE